MPETQDLDFFLTQEPAYELASSPCIQGFPGSNHGAATGFKSTILLIKHFNSHP